MLRTHCRENSFCHEEWRSQVDLDRLAPFLCSEISKPGRKGKRGVVHQDVDPSETFGRTLRNLIGYTFGGHITRNRERTIADFLRQLLSALTIANIHRYRCPTLVQTGCNSSSKPAPRTCDYRDAP